MTTPVTTKGTYWRHDSSDNIKEEAGSWPIPAGSVMTDNRDIDGEEEILVEVG